MADTKPAAALIGQILGLLDHLFTQPNQSQVMPMARIALRTIPDYQWASFLSYLESDKGQVHLQTLRNTADKLLDDWP